MKKQIFILMFFVAALLAGNSNVLGQVTYPLNYKTVPDDIPTCIVPTPLDPGCASGDPLHPSVGVPYEYTVETSANTTDLVRFFVINNADVKTGSDEIINITTGILPTGSSYIDPGDGSGTYIANVTTAGTYNAMGTHRTIEITWKYFDGKLPNEVLLVAYVEGADGCTNNLIVWRILPEFNFTLDIAALSQDGSSIIATAGESGDGPCASPIESATYEATSDGPTPPTGLLTVDYGENWLYFIVNAANFNDSWMPEFEISSNKTPEAIEASWTYLQAANNDAATWNTITTGTPWTSAVPVYAGGSDADGVAVNGTNNGVAVGPVGECIVIRVRVDHGINNENTTDEDIRVAVNGVMWDADNSNYTNRTNYEDLHHADCTQDGFTNDWVIQTITPRPEIDDDSPNPDEDKTGDE